MWTRYVRLALLLPLLSTVVMTAEAQADGYVETTGTYAEGAQIRGNRYATDGSLKVSGSISSGVTATATAVAPTPAEGSTTGLSINTVNGALRVEESKLRPCEDQTNNLCMTSGGLTRQQVIATAMLVAGDAAFKATQPGYAGSKSFQARLTGTGAITQTVKIYGGFNSVLTLTNSKLLCTLTLSGTTETSDTCDPVTAAFTFYSAVTSGTTGTSASGELIMGF